MYSWDDPKDRVAIVQLNSELRHAELDMLSAACATDRLRLRFSLQDIARYAAPDILRKAISIAGSLHDYYSSIARHAPAVSREQAATKGVGARGSAFPRWTGKSTNSGNDLDYSVVTKASPDLAWRVFTDCSRWPKFSDIYGQIRWTEGEAWQPGSRLLIQVVRPVRIQVEHRITTSVPAKRVGWIDEGLGTTIKQWVYFEALPDGGTRVRTFAEFSGIARIIAGRPLRQVLLDFTTKWYESYRAECDRLADATGRS